MNPSTSQPMSSRASTALAVLVTGQCMLSALQADAFTPTSPLFNAKNTHGIRSMRDINYNTNNNIKLIQPPPFQQEQKRKSSSSSLCAATASSNEEFFGETCLLTPEGYGFSSMWVFLTMTQGWAFRGRGKGLSHTRRK